jgi:hypothetical protein
MLQSTRVRPSSSCLRAGRNLHLEGNGFVTLERDNLAVEGGPNPGPRHLRSRTEQHRAEEPPASRRRGPRGGRARTWRLAAKEVVVRRRRGDGVELDDEVEVERGGVGRRSSDGGGSADLVRATLPPAPSYSPSAPPLLHNVPAQSTVDLPNTMAGSTQRRRGSAPSPPAASPRVTPWRRASSAMSWPTAPSQYPLRRPSLLPS